jgi:iron complex outermembrane receptor protein
MLGYSVANFSFSAVRDTLVSVLLEPVSYTMDEVRVETNRAGIAERASSRKTISEENLHRHRGETLSEALRDVPGVDMISMGPGITKPVIRGFHSQRVRILNNGIVQEGQQWGGDHAPEIDPFAASRITVIKGAAGLAYGPGSIGGVVLVEPEDWDFKHRINGTADAAVFSNNGAGSGALQLQGALTPAWAWRAQASGRVAGDAAAPGYRITNSGYRENNLRAGLAWRLGNQLLDINMSHFQTVLGVYKGAHIGSTEDLLRAIERGRPLENTPFTYAIAAPRQQVRHFTFNSRYVRQFETGARFSLQYGWQRNHRQEYDGHRRFGDVGRLRPAFDLTLSTYTLEGVWQHQPINQFVWKAGFSGMRQFNYREGAFLIPGYNLLGGGAFWMGTWSTGSWGFEGGLRYDAQQLDIFPVQSKNIRRQQLLFGKSSASLSVLRHFNESNMFGFTIGQSWRPPAVNELFSDGVHHGTAQYETGNRDLKAEISRTADLTFKHEDRIHHIEVSGYVNRMKGFIYARPLGAPVLTIRGAFPAFGFTQTNAFLYGFEFLAESQWRDDFLVTLNGSWLRGVDRTKDAPLLFMPAPRVGAMFHYDVAKKRKHVYFVEAGMRHVFRQRHFPKGIDYLDPPPAYRLFSLSAGMVSRAKERPVRLSLHIENLFNTAYRDYLSRYRYFIDEPGRNVIVRMHYPF